NLRNRGPWELVHGPPPPWQPTSLVFSAVPENNIDRMGVVHRSAGHLALYHRSILRIRKDDGPAVVSRVFVADGLLPAFRGAQVVLDRKGIIPVAAQDVAIRRVEAGSRLPGNPRGQQLGTAWLGAMIESCG